MRTARSVAMGVVLVSALVASPAQATRWLLVDFHDSDVASTFGSQYPTWDTIIRHSGNTAYVDPDGNPDHEGIADSGSSPGNDITYYGISGSTAIDFQRPQRVIATFYNRSGSQYTLIPRISFHDADSASGAGWDTPWHRMYPNDYDLVGSKTIYAGELREYAFNINDPNTIVSPNAQPTVGQHTLINIGLTSFNTNIVLTKIELSDESDITPPNAPVGLQAQMVTASTEAGNSLVELTWTEPTDPAGANGVSSGIDRYYVYRNGVLHEQVSDLWTQYFETQGSTVTYRDYHITPGASYTYEVVAVDRAIGGWHLLKDDTRSSPRYGNESSAASVVINVPSISYGPTLIDPQNDLQYLGAFRLPNDTPADDWGYAGFGLACNPNGNPGYDPNSELPGSLYAVGHAQVLNIGEITIAKPTLTTDLAQMNRATTLQAQTFPWAPVYSGDWRPPGGNAVKVHIGYHPGGNGVGPKVYYGIYRFYAGDVYDRAHGALHLDLSQTAAGNWYIGDTYGGPNQVIWPYTARYLIEANQAWCDTYTGGRSLLCGYGNSISGIGGTPTAGPSLYAIAPWESGSLPADEGVVSANNADELLLYGRMGNVAADRGTWADNAGWATVYDSGAWLETAGRSAVAILVRRAFGDMWYGGSGGDEGATADYYIPSVNTSGRGNMKTDRHASLMFYNPKDFERVLSSSLQPHEPKAYAMLDIQDTFIATANSDPGNIAVSFDRTTGYLYVIVSQDENGNLSLVHVWQVSDGGTPTNQAPSVDAGSNQTITLPTDTVNLDGTVSDDGQPDPPAAVTTTWTKFSGPGNVTFGNANAVDTTAQFSTDGVYVLQLEADDSALQTTDTVQITVNPAGGNEAPTVDAGSNQSITLPTDTVNLDGTVGDDGLPDPPAAVTTTWTKFSGTGTVTFGNANAVDTTATFSTDGVYVLQLEADDSELQTTDTVTVTVYPESSGDEIAYYALDENGGSTAGDSAGGGGDGTIVGAQWTTGKYGSALLFDGVDDSVDIDNFGTVLNMSAPKTMAAWVYCDVAPSWDDVVISFSSATEAGSITVKANSNVHDYGDTRIVTATSAPPVGEWYHLCYTYDGTTHRIYLNGAPNGTGTTVADPGQCDMFRIGRVAKFGQFPMEGKIDDVKVFDRELSPTEVDQLYQGVPTNQAPTVDAGSNQSITLPTDTVNLDGTVSDDGQPEPPAAYTVVWTKDTGPGTVTFGDANAVDTTAQFSTDGVYVLQLEADDSALQTTDTVTITVDPESLPSVAFDLTSSSGNESVTTVDLSVSLSDAYDSGTVTVDYAVTGGTAVDPDDYSIAASPLTFNPGVTQQDIVITVVNDGDVESDETIEVTLSNPSNATLGVNTVHTYTIIDDDAGGGTVYWGGGTGVWSVAANWSGGVLPGASDTAVIASGDASVDGDLATAPAEIRIDAGGTISLDMSQATLSHDLTLNGGTIEYTTGDDIMVSGDILLTADSTIYNTRGVNYRWLEFSGVISEDATSRKLTIDGDDSTRTTYISGANTYTGGTDITGAEVVLQNLSALGTGPVDLAGGDLRLTVDGTYTHGTVTVGTGSYYEVYADLPYEVIVLDGGTIANHEDKRYVHPTCSLTLNSPSAIRTLTANVNQQFYIQRDITGTGPMTIQEGSAGRLVIQYPQSWTGGTDVYNWTVLDSVGSGSLPAGDVTVHATDNLSIYTDGALEILHSGGLTSSHDLYLEYDSGFGTYGTLDLGADITVNTLTVDGTPVTAGTYTQGTDLTNYLTGPSANTITVLSPTGGQPTVEFDATSSSGDESVTTVNLSVSLSESSGSTVTVDFAVTGGDAVNPDDFTIAASPLTFNPGVTQQDIVITVVDDGLVESNETIEVTLSNPSNATLGANTVHTYTITNDDSYPTVAFDATSSSGSEGVATVNLSVSLSATYPSTVTVPYSVTGGTAVDPADYSIAASPLTFNAGVTQQDIVITVVDDSDVESDETIEVTLGSPTNATLGGNTVHTYTILDNDTAPPPGQASSPSPANGATKVSRSATLSWTAGSGADSHDVYFGTNPNPGASEFQGNQAGTTFDPGYLGKNTWYYWRIDEVNANGTTTGVVWSFKSASK